MESAFPDGAPTLRPQIDGEIERQGTRVSTWRLGFPRIIENSFGCMEWAKPVAANVRRDAEKRPL